MKGSQIEPAYKTKKIASVIYNVLLISPIIATITFFILFSTVLKGRLIERSSHALIVFVLWVYATAFYINILEKIANDYLTITTVCRRTVGGLQFIIVHDRIYKNLLLCRKTAE